MIIPSCVLALRVSAVLFSRSLLYVVTMFTDATNPDLLMVQFRRKTLLAWVCNDTWKQMFGEEWEKVLKPVGGVLLVGVCISPSTVSYLYAWLALNSS